LGHCFTCIKFGHKVVNCIAYGRNVQARDGYVALSNIECYKFHNYVHIALNYRSMIEPPMKESMMPYTIRFGEEMKKKEHVNEDQVADIVLTRFTTTQYHDESTCKEKDVRI
jgi:hypothetical protein